jgi:LysM repeat protein
MSSAKVFLPLFLLVIMGSLLAACGGGGDSGDSGGSQSLTDPRDVPTATPWATPPPVVYVEGGPVPVNGGSEGKYAVEPGDTAYGIATRFNITVEELAAANNMTVEEIANLSVGQELVIPQAPPEQQPVTTTTPTTGEPTATTTPAAGEPESTPTPSAGEPESTPTAVAGEEGTYTVQEGDIPVTIAEQFGITVEALLEANDITDPTSLTIGQVLVIPTPTPEP